MATKVDEVVRTPSGVVSRQEYEQLQQQYPEGIPSEAVREVVRKRTEELQYDVDRKREQRQRDIASITDLTKREDVQLYRTLRPKEQFDKAVELGLIKEGSKFVSKIDVDWSKSGLSPAEIQRNKDRIERLTGRSTETWGYYTPEQVTKIEEAKKARVAAIETRRKDVTRAKAYRQALIIRSEKELAEFEANHVKLPGLDKEGNEQWISNDEAQRIKKQSSYGYDILTTQGLDAYTKAISDAEAQLEPYKRAKGYRLKPAVADGITEETLSLLFTKADVKKALEVKRDTVTKPKTTSSLLPGSVAALLPVLGAVAVAEPTPIGEIIVVGGALLAATVAAVQTGKQLNWSALKDDVIRAFTKEKGRSPTKVEVEQLEELATISGITPTTVKGLGLVGGPQVSTPSLNIVGGPSAAVKGLSVVGGPKAQQLSVGLVGDPKTTIKLGTMGGPKAQTTNLGVLASQTALAEKKLEDALVLIRSKIAEPGKYLPATVPKTDTALVRLDEAVQDAVKSGEIDVSVLRVYSTARNNYLTKKGLLDAGMKTYTGGIQPKLTSDARYATAVTIQTTLGILQSQANQAAIAAYNEAISKGVTQTQAKTKAEQAAREAIKTNTTTAIKAVTSTAVQPQVLTKTALQTLVTPAVKTAVNTATTSLVNTATTTLTTTSITTVPPIILPSGKGKDKKIKLTKKEKRSATSWPQGFGWWVVFIRNGKKYAYFHHGQEAPKGIRQVKQGEGEAYRGIQRYKGTGAAKFKMPLGVVDVAVGEPEEEPGRTGAIRFTPRRPLIK